MDQVGTITRCLVLIVVEMSASDVIRIGNCFSAVMSRYLIIKLKSAQHTHLLSYVQELWFVNSDLLWKIDLSLLACQYAVRICTC